MRAVILWIVSRYYRVCCERISRKWIFLAEIDGWRQLVVFETTQKDNARHQHAGVRAGTTVKNGLVLEY